MGLDRYETQARLIADELLDLLTDAERKQIARLLKRKDADLFWDDLTDMKQIDDAIALLSATPAERTKRWQKTAAEDRSVLWIRARTLGLRSASVLRAVIDVQTVEGMKYRHALRHIARSGLTEPRWPQPEELLDRAF